MCVCERVCCHGLTLEWWWGGGCVVLWVCIPLSRRDQAWPEVQSAQHLSKAVRQIAEMIGSACEGLRCRGCGYVIQFLVRKFVLGMVVCGRPGAPAAMRSQDQIDWGQVTLGELKVACPDQAGVLSEFPERWSARDLSMFMCDRPDHGLLVTMHARALAQPAHHSRSVAIIVAINRTRQSMTVDVDMRCVFGVTWSPASGTKVKRTRSRPWRPHPRCRLLRGATGGSTE